MKKIILFALMISIISCKNKESKKEELGNTSVETTAAAMPVITTPQVKAIFDNEEILLSGKISELDSSAYINVKERNTSGDVLFEAVLSFDGKIAVGKHISNYNFSYGVLDAKHKIKLPSGDELPVTYKQMGGEFEITKVENNLVSGSFSVKVYNLKNKEEIKTITGSFDNLPVKEIGK